MKFHKKRWLYITNVALAMKDNRCKVARTNNDDNVLSLFFSFGTWETANVALGVPSTSTVVV